MTIMVILTYWCIFPIIVLFMAYINVKMTQATIVRSTITIDKNAMGAHHLQQKARHQSSEGQEQTNSRNLYYQTIFPLEIYAQSSNAHMWPPQLVLLLVLVLWWFVTIAGVGLPHAHIAINHKSHACH